MNWSRHCQTRSRHWKDHFRNWRPCPFSRRKRHQLETMDRALWCIQSWWQFLLWTWTWQYGRHDRFAYGRTAQPSFNERRKDLCERAPKTQGGVPGFLTGWFWLVRFPNIVVVFIQQLFSRGVNSFSASHNNSLRSINVISAVILGGGAGAPKAINVICIENWMWSVTRAAGGGPHASPLRGPWMITLSCLPATAPQCFA
jgi:hypothetical protein